jgi:hypothetical protein
VPTPTGTPPAYGNQANDGFNSGTTIEYNYADDSYKFTRADGRSVNVGKGNLTPGARLGGDSPFFSSTNASVYTVTNAGKVTQTVATLPPGDYGVVKMSHMAVTFWDIYYGETGRHDQQWLVWGNQTPTMPTTGSASYKLDGGIGGNGFDSASGKYYQFLNGDSTGSLGVDFATGNINLLLHLIGAEAVAGGADKDFGNYTGTGAISSGTAQYGGTIAGDGTGKFDGAFFGPDAAETGLTFFVNNGTTGVNGVAVGQKQP